MIENVHSVPSPTLNLALTRTPTRSLSPTLTPSPTPTVTLHLALSLIVARALPLPLSLAPGQETYSLLLDTFVKDKQEKARLFNAIETIPCVARKAQWALKYITDSKRFAERLVAFAVVEGIFFSASFCSIYYMKKRGKLPGLCFRSARRCSCPLLPAHWVCCALLTFAPFFFTSNELIARDEGLHTDFACELYSMLQRKLSDAEVHAIVGEAVEVEIDFVTNALPTALIGINSELMSKYVRFCADRLLLALGVPKLYHADQPFEWMGARGRRVQPLHPHHRSVDNATLLPCRAHFAARQNVCLAT